jgi:cytochrome c oxidase subunit 2
MRRMGLLALFCTAIATANAASFQNALTPMGPQAEHIRSLWLIMVTICGAAFLAVIVAVLLALWRSPRAGRESRADTSHMREPEPRLARGVTIALAITVLGLLVLMAASVITDRALNELPLKDGIAIEVTAHQWWWRARYQAHSPELEFDTANELHIPVGRPVIVKLQSRDVIHSFWVPNLHGKKDLIPGRITLIQFRADRPGVYRGQCAEFCGYQHAKMGLVIVAEEEKDYQRWLTAQRAIASAPADDVAKQGQQVFLSAPCVMCHTIRGTDAHGRTAPDLTHLASRSTIAAGTLPNSRGNLGGWILDPQRVKPGVNMPPTALAPDDLQALLQYLESLK